MARYASRGAHLIAWLLLIAGLAIIALNPGVPSLRYAAFWLGILAGARGVALLVPWLAPSIDLALLLPCILGLEIGGLILVPSLLAFTVADVLRREEIAAT